MSDTVRLGIIGCGGISARHIQWSLERGDCEFTALCDLLPEAMENRKAIIQEKRPGADPVLTEDYNELLARDDVDGVLVLLPHYLHHPVTKAALEAGKHVLTEKPMVTTVEDAADLVETVERTGLVFGIGYQRSYLPEYLHVHNMVKNGDFGSVRFMTGHVEQAWFANVSKKQGGESWRNIPEQAGGGQLVDTGSHTCAAMLYVCDMDPVEVYAMVDNCGLNVDVDTSLVVRFAQGAQATLSVGGFGHKVTETIRVVGDNASARIFFRTVKEQSLEIDGEIVDADQLAERSDPNANFIDAILGKATIGADAKLGLRVSQLSDAAYRSAQTGQPVKVG